MKYELKINSYFWKKDSIGLFDYEAKDLITSSQKINFPGNISSNENDTIEFSDKLQHKSLNYLASVITDPSMHNNLSVKIRKDIYLKPIDSNHRVASDNWLILKHTYSKEDSGFKLREGIMIKLGKVVFKVREVSVRHENEEEPNNEEDLLEHEYRLDRNTTNNDILSNNFGLEEAEDANNIDNNNNIDNDNIENMLENNIFNENDNFNDYNSNSNNNDLNSNSNNNGVFSNITYDQISYSKNITNVPIKNSNTNNLTNAMVINIQSHKQKFDFKNQKIILKSVNNRNNYAGRNMCRICLGDASEDILLSVCKCLGSVKFLHLSCLRKWLISKISIKTFNHLNVYSYKNLECELCKAPIKETITIKNKTINLINLNQVAQSMINSGKKFFNYIALECIKDKPVNPSSEQKEKKTIYVINLKEKRVLKVGRSTESDVRMTDISVSRNHAVFNIQDGSMYLKDINSKFGTHVNIETDQHITILPYKKLAIQCGKYYLSFELVKTYLAYICCFKDYNSSFSFPEDYNEYFEKIYKEKEKLIVEKEEFRERERSPGKVILPIQKEEDVSYISHVTGSHTNTNNTYSNMGINSKMMINNNTETYSEDEAKPNTSSNKNKKSFYKQKTFNAVNVMKKLDLNQIHHLNKDSLVGLASGSGSKNNVNDFMLKQNSNNQIMKTGSNNLNSVRSGNRNKTHLTGVSTNFKFQRDNKQNRGSPAINYNYEQEHDYKHNYPNEPENEKKLEHYINAEDIANNSISIVNNLMTDNNLIDVLHDMSQEIKYKHNKYNFENNEELKIEVFDNIDKNYCIKSPSFSPKN